MESQNFSSQLRRSILVHSTMGILIIGLTVSIVSIAFFYFNLRSDLIDKLAYSLRIKSMTVDEFSNRAQDITLQITSRTKIREKLEEFNRGEIRREQLTAFSAPLLVDAMRQSSEIAGISRLDAKGELAVSIGIPIPPAAWPNPETLGEKVRFRGPLILEGKSYLVLGAAIIGQENRRAGTDIVLFNTEKLQEFLKDYTGLEKRGETILGLPGNGGINLLVPLRAEMKSRPLAAPIVLSPTAPVAEALRNGLANKSGTLIPDATSIIAYGPLSRTGWALAVRMDKDELYAPMYHEILMMVAIILLLLLIGYYGMIVLLRPLTKAILIKAEDLEKQIKEKTAQLEVSTAALLDEKDQLIKSHAELGKTYADLKAAQSRILQQEKMASIGQLAAGVAHEINNPMGFIISNLNTLVKYIGRILEVMQTQDEALEGLVTKGSDEFIEVSKRVNEKKRQAKMDYITKDTAALILESIEGAERVKKIVQDLKDFSCIDTAEWGDQDINAGLDSTLRMLTNVLNQAVITKKYGDLPLIRCNIGQLNQAFMNILTNAAQSIAPQGEIIVETWSDHNSVFISIADDGCGIRTEDLDRIFEPFFTTKEVGHGTGLGLSIAYDIVKNHNGTMQVCSEVGHGTTLTIKLPVV
ncbi:MAG: ATP-binding protein [Desulfurivibrionaceae bacterium]